MPSNLLNSIIAISPRKKPSSRDTHGPKNSANMPVQINQLHIKINIKDEDAGSSESRAGAKSKGKQDELVQKCVEAVMEILERKKER